MNTDTINIIAPRSVIAEDLEKYAKYYKQTMTIIAQYGLACATYVADPTDENKTKMENAAEKVADDIECNITAADARLLMTKIFGE